MSRPKPKPISVLLFEEDWLRPLASLTTASEYGALHRLAHLSIHSKPPCTLPNDDGLLARKAGVSAAEWASIRKAIEEFMRADGDLVHFDWLRRRYDARVAYTRDLSASGRSGAEQRWRRHSDAIATPCQRHSDANAFSVPVLVPVQEKPKPQETTAAQSADPAAKPAKSATAPPAGPATRSSTHDDGLWGSARWGIRFDPANRAYVGITDYDYAAWRATYPAVDIDAELRKAAEWCLSCPQGRKSNYRKFLRGWLTKAQDQAGAARNGTHAPKPAAWEGLG